jgi:putative transposase
MRTHHYPRDVTDAQWKLIEPHIPPEPGGGRPRKTEMRDVLDAILYILRTGCQWRYLPGDLPPKSTVWRYFDRWRSDGTLDTIHDRLRRKVRTAEKPYHPRTSASVDSQSVDTTSGGEQRGRDNFKNVDGRKRHIVVDSMGLLLAVLVTAADVDDAWAAPELFAGWGGSRSARWCGCTPTASTTTSRCTSGSRRTRGGSCPWCAAPRGPRAGSGCRSAGRWSGRSPGWRGAGG